MPDVKREKLRSLRKGVIEERFISSDLNTGGEDVSRRDQQQVFIRPCQAYTKYSFDANRTKGIEPFYAPAVPSYGSSN